MNLFPRRPFIVLIALFLVGGCDTLGENEQRDAGPRAVLVANQGNFGDGNGSVTVYDAESDVADVAAIHSLGTIIQSLAIHDERIYVMSNTGGRIDVFDARSLERIDQITDVVSPRYMLADGSTAYVTSLYGARGSYTGGLVTVVDLEEHAKIDEIAVGNNPEGLALVGTRLYVANSGFGAGMTVSVIDTETRQVVDTVDVECDGPRFLTADAEDEVFVFCTGKTIYDENFEVVGETSGAVRVLDGPTGEIVQRIAVDGRITTEGPGQDAYHDVAGEAIFVVKDAGSVLVFDTATNGLVDEIGPFAGEPISAVAFDGAVERLYVGRSNGFTQAGRVSIHDRSGAAIGGFGAGIVPAYIAFRSDE